MGQKTSIVPQMDFLSPHKIMPSHRPKQLTGKRNTLVLEYLKTTAQLGATAQEIEQALGWLDGTVSPRLSELRSMGYARRTDAHRNGKSVWVAV